jgi:hypothetical protein
MWWIIIVDWLLEVTPMVDSDAVLASTWKKGSQGFDHAPTVS